MADLFYQANFCAECGNELEPRRNWRPRYFCDDCAARRRRRGYLKPLSLLAGLLVIGSLFNGRTPPLDHAAPAVSAVDATPKQKLLPPPQAQERVMCGARTKKGTPCRRLVPPGERCAQHRGMPSMLLR